MISVVLLILVILLAYVVVVAGATAYELTGLDRKTAFFQALSAFTGTGFTTRVSHLVVAHPQRRRITSILIILGYAGTATVVASLVTSVDQDTAGGTVLNLLALAAAAAAAWVLIQRVGTNMLGDVIRRFLAPRITGEQVPHEELLLYKKGFGLTRIEIPPESNVVGKTLKQLDLRAFDVQVLAIEVRDEVHPIPDPDWVFFEGQHLIVYGDLRRVQDAFGPR